MVLVRRSLAVIVECARSKATHDDEAELRSLFIARTSMAKKILLVEDSDTTRLSHRIMITRRTGYEVITVANGAEALKLAATQKPDLVLMDVMMPGMDGLEVCRRLRKEKATAKVPIVLLTFRVGDESVSEGYASGCTAYLKKPVEIDDLVHTLRQHLGE